MVKIWCALLFGTLCAFAQAPKSENVLMMTGRMWETMPETTKLAYVHGIKDGLTIAALSLPAELREAVIDYTQAKGFNTGDYVNELDQLFAQRENLNIVVPLAYHYIPAKLKGTSTSQEVEQRLIELRKAMAK